MKEQLSDQFADQLILLKLKAFFNAQPTAVFLGSVKKFKT